MQLTKTKKHILTVDQEYDFEMIGICSHHNDYRLAWGINERLGINLLRCEEEYVATNKKGQRISDHSMYEFKDVDNFTEYYLVKNKSLGKFLIPEKPTIDYFLFLYENYSWETDKLIAELREVQSILGVFSFDPEEIESTEQLIFN